MNSKAQIPKTVCDALSAGDTHAAKDIARDSYPFVSSQSTGRAYSESQCTAVFLRDGFIDRYSGAQLVFPGTLRLLSRLLPSELVSLPSELENERDAHGLLGAFPDD